MKIEYYEDMLEERAINKYLNMIANDYNGELARIFEEKYINKDKEIERLIISLQAQEELTMNEHIKVERLHSIIKEVREYITSYESIETIQQCEHSENNKGLDRDTMREMTNRYLKVHDKILEILDKENKE